MSNYYDECLKQIDDLLKVGKNKEALDQVSTELQMPYVPEPYFSKFNQYLNEIVVDAKPKSQYFESVEEIEFALMGNEALQQKAILSLERMNLRSEAQWIQDILVDEKIQDWVKKQILLFMMEQELQGTYPILMQGLQEEIKIQELIHPQASVAYATCAKGLQEALESDNPSMLILCMGELEMMALEAFPHQMESISSAEIIQRVASYF